MWFYNASKLRKRRDCYSEKIGKLQHYAFKSCKNSFITVLKKTMRHILAIFVTLFFLKTSALAQSDTTTVLKDSVRTMMLVPEDFPRSNQVMIMWGSAPLPAKELNEFLKSSRYSGSQEFSTNTWEAFDYRALETEAVFEKWRLMTNIYYQASSVQREGRFYQEGFGRRTVAVDFLRFGIEIGGGYNVFRKGAFSLYPFLLLGSQFNALVIQEGRSVSFSNTFEGAMNDSTPLYSNSAVSSNITLQPGVGGDVRIYTFFKEDERKQPLAVTLGARVAYSASLPTSPWNVNGRQYDDGPDVSGGGMRVSVGVGFAILNRTFKARIISEDE